MKKRLLFCVILIFIMGGSFAYYKGIYNRNLENKQIKFAKAELEKDILNHYSNTVVTNNISDIYKFENGEYTKSGTLGVNQSVELKEINVTSENTFFPLLTFEDYYIYYKDVEKYDKHNEKETELRFKNYIPFNENIITNDNTSFYDENNALVYSFNMSFDLPVIVKEDDKFGVEFNDRLLYVKSDDVKSLSDNQNSSLSNTNSIAVLNYHFFFDNEYQSEIEDCNQIICLSVQNFRSHLDFIKENNIFTPTLNELEMYLDGKIQLPKSVVITIDDGWRMNLGIDLLEEYNLNGTVFLITSWFDKINFLNSYKYVEFHSHGDDLHNQGECPGGQGGAIKCKDRTYLLNDLTLSRDKLSGSRYFCYPFYEYNDYSISVLKEAGFTMAFAGGGKRTKIGVDKYQIPRYVIYSTTTANDLASYIGY